MNKQLHLLVNLARIDGNLDSKEKDMIFSIGTAHGLGKDEIEDIISNPESEIELEELSEDEKLEYLCNLVQLMKIDGKVYNGEIVYCQNIATRLGYDKDVILELYKVIYSDPSVRVPESMIREIVEKFLT